MRRLWFCMPAHGRLRLTEICLEQLRRTCGLLAPYGIQATAVVIAEDGNLDTASRLGFATVNRGNDYLARKYNDGIQLACDPDLNPEPADYVVPIGSDDWVDDRIFHRLPAKDCVLGFRHVSFVSEDGRHLTETRLAYEGGVGIRVYPRHLLEVCGYRPADEDRKRACDTSILYNVRRNYRWKYQQDIRVVYGDLHTRQVVDWKTPGEQLNTYKQVTGLSRSRPAGDPFPLLDGLYPADLLNRMREHYGR